MTPSSKQLVITDVDCAARLLKTGGLVGMPTETVYGLGGAARQVSAVARIFAIKGRPADHPLIIHIGSARDLDEWTSYVPAYAQRLGEALWPGPLTLVLPRRMNDEDDHFAGGQPSVALRVPSHPMALALLTAFGNGIAAPSANLFGRVSPTTAHHVVEGLGRYLVPGRDAILDGGASQVGIESSIVDCTGEAPIILRPGAVTVEEIVRVGLVAVSQRPSHVRAPGTLVSHYAPQATVVVATEADMMLEMLTGKGLTGQGGFGQTDVPEQGLLALAETPTPEGVVRLAAPKDEADFARCLYAALHKADALRLTRVVVLVPPAEGIGLAIRDRVSRAASGARSAKGVGPGLPSVANHAAGR